MKKEQRTETGIQAIYPANSLQQGFIFHAVSHPSDTAYRVQSLCDYYHEIDSHSYKEAWNLAIKTYPSLRTCFNWDETPIQIITKHGQLQFNFHDLSLVEDKELAVLAIQDADYARAFDLTKPTLLRLHLIKHHQHHYTLLKTEHHSISDAWSAAILLNQVHDYYNQLTAGVTPRVVEDLAYLQAQAFIAKHQFDAQLHWQKITQETHQANDVSALFNKRANFDLLYTVEAARELDVELNSAHYERLKTLVHDEGLTLHGLVQFAWHKLLHTYTEDAQTIVGTTLSGRGLPIAGIEKSVGLYINTLPLIVNWEDAGTIKEQLQYIHAQIMGLNQYSFVYLSALQKAGRKLFHSLLLFENPSIALKKGSNTTQLIASNRRGTQKLNYPIALTVHPQMNTLRINCKYDGNHLCQQRAEDVLNQLLLILQQIPCKLNTSHHHLNLLMPKEHEFIINTLNNTNAPFPADKTLQAMFTAQVARTPDAIALVCEERQLTYAELNKETNQLAQWLHTQNFGPNALVVVCMERSPELLIAILGILKAGGAYVPVDPHYPLDRIQYLLDDTGTHFVLTQSRHLASFKDITDTKIQWIALDKKPYQEAPDTPLSVRSAPSDLAYVIYTSGTTGRPKGVAIPHSGAVNRLHWMQKTYPLNEQDVVLQKTPYVFDVSVWELLWAHWTGAKIVMARPEGHKDASYLHQLMVKEGVTVLHFVPSMLSAFTEALTILETRVPSSVRYVFCSGEALFPNQVQAFYALCEENAAIHNLYGPTEASIDVTAFACERDTSAVYIGRPIQNTRVYVLNAALKPVPIGAPGDLYLGGAGLARNYWNKPDLTKAAFIDNPFASEEDKAKGYVRLYKTGDLVRWLPDGNLEYIGRSDFQVKVRGFRIELGEIEQIMLSHSEVTQAVALVKEQAMPSHTHRFIAAFYVGNIAPDTLKEQLMERLPDYMVPTQLIKLSAFPVTNNGKLDRKALIAPALDLNETREYVAPQTPLERTLCDIWQKVLQVPKVGVTDSFFELGGDSIESIRLVSMMQRAGFHVSMRDIFTRQTILQLIEKTNHTVEKVARAYTPYSLIDNPTREQLQAHAIEDIYPAAYLQMGMLVESLKKGAEGTYHDVFAYTINRPLHEELLLSTFQELTLKHPLLRTAFIEHPKYGYVCLQHASIKITNHYVGIIQQNIRDFIANEKNTPFTLAEPGLFRLIVLNQEDSQFVLVFSFHHAITDGWSVASLMAEFTGSYINGEAISSETLPLYQRVIQAEREALASSVQQTFWRNYLKDAPAIIPHLVFNPQALVDSPQLEQGYLVNETLAMAVLRKAKESAIGPDILFLAAYLMSLSRLCQQKDIVIGLIMNNRLEEAGGDKIFGLHLNTLPLRIKINEPNLTKQLAECRALLETYKAYPYGKIRTDLAAANDLYTSAFNYIHFHIVEDHMRSQALRSTHMFEKTTVPLTFHVSRQKDSFHIAIKAANHFIDEETANLLLASIQYDLAILTNTTPAVALTLPENHEAVIQSLTLKHPLKKIAHEFVAPKTELEYKLVDIWQTVLQKPAVGITDNFFEMGGDSIESIRLVAMMQRAGFHVSVSDIFTHKTISHLIEHTNYAAKKEIPPYTPYSLIDAKTKSLLQNNRIEDIYPAGYLQMGMLVESLKDNAEGTYHDVFAYTINHALDEKRLVSLFQQLTEKHPLLRTAFMTHGTYGYVCLQHTQIDMTRHYLGCKQEEVSHFIAIEKNTKLPIEEPGLFRLTVLNPKATQFVLVFSFHHAITDGWSVASLMAEFVSAYVKGEPLQKDHIPPYPRVIQAEREALASDAHVTFWRDYLRDAELPAPHLVFNPQALSEEPLVETGVSLDEKGAAALLLKAKLEGVAPDLILLAAYINTLSRLCKQQDIIVGLVMNNRLEETGGDKLFGLHLNTLPLRINTTNNPLVQTLAQQRATLEAFKAYPYGKIRSSADLYTCAFNYIHFHVAETHGQALRTMQVFEKTNVPLTLHVVRQKESFRLSLKALNHFIDNDTAELLLVAIQYDLALLTNQTTTLELTPPPNQDDVIQHWKTAQTTQLIPHEFVAPRNVLERTLTDIWQTVLHVPAVGITDNFFELGGDSIESIRLVALMQRAGFHVSVNDIFTHKTISQLIERTNHTAERHITTYTPYALIDETTRALLQKSPIEDIYPAGYLQMGMLVESLKKGAEDTYHDVFAYTINHPLDEQLLIAIFQQLTDKHSLLRSAFIEHPQYGYVCLQYKDVNLRKHYQGIIEQPIADFIAKEKNHPLPIAEPGLFRLFVLNPNATQFTLVFSFHHAITDGWSVASLVAEFTNAYTNRQPIAMTTLPPYQRVIQAEQEALSSSAQQIFWQNYLQNTVPAIPHLVFNQKALTNETLLEKSIVLDEKEANALFIQVKQQGVSPDLILLAAYIRSLSRLSMQKDMVVGIVMNNRLEEDGGDNIFGLHLNTLPLRAKVGEGDLLTHLFQQRALINAYKAYPYGKIRAQFSKEREIYTCAFNYIHFHVVDDQVQSKTLQSTHVFEKTNVPLTLHIARQNKNFRLTIKAANHFIDEETANLLLASIQYDLAILTNTAPTAPLTLPENHEAVIQSLALQHPLKKIAHEFVAPKTELQHKLADIWQTVLQKPAVGITDNFFEMGGDSIESIRLVAMMQRAGVHVSVSDIFTHKTISQLIEHTNYAAKKEIPLYTPYSLIDAKTKSLLQNNRIEDIYPAGYLQMGMLVESLKDNAEGTYHDVFAYTINHALDEKRLVSLFQQLTEKHPLLRTAFIAHGTYGYVCLQHTQIDMTHHYLGCKQEEVSHFIAIEKNTKLPIDEPGLFRLTVLNPAATKFVLVFSFHHAITDGWSVASLMAEFVSAYVKGEPIQKDHIPPYPRVIQAEREALASDAHVTFWRDYLRDAERPAPHLVFNPQALSEEPLVEAGVSLDEKAAAALLLKAKLEGVSPDLILLAAYINTLSRLCKQQDIIVGLVMNNRLEETGGDKLFGLHLNTLPLRINTTNNPLVQALAQQRATLEAFKAYPYGKIRSSADLYTCAFNYIHFHVVETHGQAFRTMQVFEKTNVPLTLHVVRQKESFRLSLKALNHFIDNDTAELLLVAIQYDLALLTNQTTTLELTLPPNQDDVIQLWKTAQTTQLIPHEFVAPRNALERTLSDIWQTVLHVPAVGITDNFFELGGDSIESIRLVALMQRAGFQVSVNDIFTHKTISQLIEHTNHTAERHITTYTPYALIDEAIQKQLQTDTTEDIYPASFLQIKMLTESLKREAEGTYHDVFAYTVNRPFNEKLFLTIFQQLTLKHPVLRTAFVEHNDHAYLCVQHKHTDIADHYSGIVKQEVRTFVNTEITNPLPIAEPGLFRLIVLNPEDNQFELVFSFHHAITDGWSVATLMAEFTAAYANDKTITIEALPPYPRIIQAEREAVASSANQLFWRDYLQNAPSPISHLVFNPHALVESSILEEGLLIDEEKANAILAQAKHLGVSPDLIFLAAYLNALSHLCKEPDLIVGLVMNNRLEEAGGDKVFGLHLNILPLRMDMKPAYVDDKETLINALAKERVRLGHYKAYPYAKMRQDFTNSQDVYTCAFNYTHFHVNDAQSAQGILKPLYAFEKMSIPLTIQISRHLDKFRLILRASRHFIDKETARHLIDFIKEKL